MTLNEPAQPGPRRPRALIVGCGYVGQRLANRLADIYDVSATVRSQGRVAELQAAGIEAAALDLDQVRDGHWAPAQPIQRQPTQGAPEPAVIFYLTPPPPHGESDTRLDRFLRLTAATPLAFIYMSTSGVYGNAGGERVDESSPVNPLTDRARRRVSAEEMTRVWCTERRVRRVVLRVPGIYGPGRLPIERLRRGEPTLHPHEAGLTNRIHVDDLVEACVAAAFAAEACGVYNVTDGNATSSTAFLDRLAELAGLPRAPRISLDEAQLTLSPERLSYLNESRRISNQRMLTHLRVKLRYANLDDGLRHSLGQASPHR